MTNPFVRAWKWWYTPRSTDPTIAYRERALRSLLPIVILLRVLGTTQNYSGAPDQPEPYAPLWVSLSFIIIPLLFTFYFLARQKVNWAGASFLLHWYLIDMLSLPAEGYWYAGYQISIIIQALLGTLFLPSRAILPFMIFQLSTIGLWGNWLDINHYNPPLLSSGQPVAVFWKMFITLAVQESAIVLIVRYLRIQMEKSLHLQQVNIKQLQTEITERKQAQLALQQLDDMYRRAIDSAGLVPYVLSHSGEHTFILTFVGEGILSMTGYSAAEITSDLWNSLILEAFPRGRLSNLTLQEADRLTNEDLSILWECDFHIRTRDGQARWIADTSVKGFDEQSEKLISIGIFQDITERKHAEEIREKLIRELEQRNAELERFAYTLSHELKSPLITIKGFVGLLRKDLFDKNIPRLETDIERISDGADKMQRLINELLELLSIGRVVNPSEKISLRTLFDEAINLLHEQITKQGIAVHIADDLPLVYGDRKRLLEVLQGLIENCVNYMGSQSQPQIEIGKRQSETDTIIYVKDNGIGIEPRFHEKIFGLFEKLNADSEGIGIGLALVKRIIEVHNGKIWVESEGLGKGSTFCFTISGSRTVEN